MVRESSDSREIVHAWFEFELLGEGIALGVHFLRLPVDGLVVGDELEGLLECIF